MNAEEYWRQQAMSVTREYDQVLDSQRDEIERLQRRCSELVRECSLAKANTASDVRRFCLGYTAARARAATARGSSSNSNVAGHTSHSVGGGAALTTTTTTMASTAWHGRSADETTMPLAALLQFLHEYSNGMVPQPENKRKRERSLSVASTGAVTTPPSPTPRATPTAAAVAAAAATPSSSSSSSSSSFAHNRRLYQRMLARQRLTGHDEDVAEWTANVDAPASPLQPLYANNNNGNNGNNSSNNSSHTAFAAAAAVGCGGGTSPRYTLRSAYSSNVGCASSSMHGSDEMRHYYGGAAGGGNTHRHALAHAAHSVWHNNNNSEQHVGSGRSNNHSSS